MKTSRNTIPRARILDILTHSDKALSHKEVQASLDELCDRATIYRVLDRLVDEGLVHKVVNVDGVVNFATCRSCTSNNHKHNHLHFSCVKCRSVTCLTNVVPKVTLPEGYVVHESQFTVSGLCPKCAVAA